MLKILVTFVFLGYVLIEVNSFFKGRKNTIIRSIGECGAYKNHKLPWPMKIEQHKYNRTTWILDAEVNLTRDFDDSLIIDLQCRKWGAGGWMNNFITLHRKSACTMFTQLFGVETFADVLKRPLTCPIKKDNYVWKAFRLDLSNIPMFITSGTFNITIKIIDGNDNQLLTCIECVDEVKEQY